MCFFLYLLRLDANGALCGMASQLESNEHSAMETSNTYSSGPLLPGQMVIDYTGKIQRNTGI